MKGFFEEFKAFAVKGNMMDLAIGMIIGAAFTAIVNSLVNDIFMPILSLITGKVDFTNMFIALDGGKYATVAEATEKGVAMIKYGAFISQIINFLCVAIVLFIIVKNINKMRDAEAKKKAEAAPAPAPAEPTEKECPYCFSMISIKATRCPHCTSEQPAKMKA